METGIKCGIEIHQRLATAHKLFCMCRPDAEGRGPTQKIRRSLVAVSGELGLVDPAAYFETERGKKYEYLVDGETACLVEADEEPPHALNAEALGIALSVCKALHSRVVDEVHVMRKTVVDGSAVSGFQRTALVGIGGHIDTSFGKVGIQAVCLEEESAGIAGAEGNVATYRLDRLGIQLVEIATAPDVKNGAQAREVAEKIGMLLRSSGKVQRGIGTIRQDINVSVGRGCRVEIKGAQELEMVEALVENEAKRQGALIALAKKAPKKKNGFENGKPEFFDVTTVFSRAGAGGFVEKGLAGGERAIAIRLDGFAGLLGEGLTQNHRFGTELSQYAKAAAGVGGIIHSDEEMEKYRLGRSAADEIAKSAGCKKADAWVACISEKENAERALGAVARRASLAWQGVQKETRRAVAGGRTEYMRPLPGSARMYPETDVPPVPITNEMLQAVSVAEDMDEKAARYEKLGLAHPVAERIAKDYSGVFETLLKTGAEPRFVASVLAETLVALRRKGSDVSRLSAGGLSEFFEFFVEGKFTKPAAQAILEKMSAGEKLEKILASGFGRLRAAQVEKIVATYRESNPDTGDEKAFGDIMRSHRNNVDPEDLSKALRGRRGKRYSGLGK